MNLEVAQYNNYLASKLIHSPDGPISAEPAYVVSVFPIFEDDRPIFGKELPYSFSGEYPYGGLTRIKIPAAQRGKIIWRSIYPDKLLSPIDVPPLELADKERIDRAGEWYFIDSIEEMKNPDAYGYTVTEVFPAFQWSFDPRSEKRTMLLVTAKDLAYEGLVKPNLSVLGRRPGKIGLDWTPVKENIPNMIPNLIEQQRIAFEALVQEAHILEREGRLNYITKLHRLAFDWLGYDPKSANWRYPTASAQQKRCMLCTQPIAREAIICPNCGLLPVKYLEAIAAGIDLDVDKSDPIYTHMEKIRTQKRK